MPGPTHVTRWSRLRADGNTRRERDDRDGMAANASTNKYIRILGIAAAILLAIGAAVAIVSQSNDGDTNLFTSPAFLIGGLLGVVWLVLKAVLSSKEE